MKKLIYVYAIIKNSKAVAIAKITAIAIGLALNFTKKPDEIVDTSIEYNIDMLMNQNDAYYDNCKRHADELTTLNNHLKMSVLED